MVNIELSLFFIVDFLNIYAGERGGACIFGRSAGRSDAVVCLLGGGINSYISVNID